MLQVKGIYDGKRINSLEEILLPPNTLVQVIVWQDSEDQENQYRQRLVESGLLNEVRLTTERLPSFTPVHVKGAPLSQTIIEERR